MLILNTIRALPTCALRTDPKITHSSKNLYFSNLSNDHLKSKERKIGVHSNHLNFE